MYNYIYITNLLYFNYYYSYNLIIYMTIIMDYNSFNNLLYKLVHICKRRTP